MKRISIAAGSLLFALLVYLLGWSSLFSVQSVDVNGAPTPASEQRIRQVTDIAIGDQLARIDQRAIKARLEPMRWIASVGIHRDWLAKKVTINVEAKVPVARFNSLYLGGDGTTFSLPGGTTKKIPSVFASTQKAGIQAATLFTDLPDDIKSAIIDMRAGNQSVSFTLDKSMQGAQSQEIMVRWGSNSDTALKVKVLRALLALPENKNIRRVDVSAPHAPIVV